MTAVLFTLCLALSQEVREQSHGEKTAEESKGAAALATEKAAAGEPAHAPSDPQAQVTVAQAGLFDLHVRDVSIGEVLRLLSTQAERNITVSSGVTGTVRADLYRVTFAEALDALLAPAGFAWYERGKFVYVCKPEERESMENAGRPTDLRMFELHFIPAKDALPVVTGLLSPRGSVVSTTASEVKGVSMTSESFDSAMNDGLSGKNRAVGEFLVVRDLPERLDQIARVIERLDARPRQVMIEAVILRARLTENNALGIDFNALAGIDFRAIGGVSNGGLDMTNGTVPPPEFDNGTGALKSDFAKNVPPGGLSFGIIANNVAMFIRALEEVVDLTIVANPKVLTLNEQLGRVIVGREDGYLTTTVTETTAVQNVEFIETGTQILFRPFIGRDGYVRMDIHPEDSNGGLTPDKLPFKDTTEVTTSVVVRDGHTLVIGGLFRDVATSRKQQIPWLGNIPIIGLLASGKQDEVLREEVVVLITPHIIEGDEDSAAAEHALNEVERIRAAAHRGLMPWGRERLAQAHYRWALEHERSGKTHKALWDLDLALSLNPRFIEADRLRERLGGETTGEADMSVIHDLIRRMARGEALPAAAPTTQPAAAGNEGARP